MTTRIDEVDVFARAFIYRKEVETSDCSPRRGMVFGTLPKGYDEGRLID